MIHISHKTKQLVVASSDQLTALFPHGRRLDLDGQEMIVLPYGLDETKLLRNLGHVTLPSPIEECYDFASADGKRAFGKQIATSAHMVMNPRSFVLNDMGTGKTKSAIWAFDFLQKTGRAKRMLVSCPLSTMRFTWEREIMNTCPHLSVCVLAGNAEKRKQLLTEKHDIYIINHDGLRVVYEPLMRRRDIDVICYDEVAAFRNAQARRSRLAQGLANGRAFVWGMTGSPTPTEPTDAFGLARLIVPATAPRSFSHFRQETMLQVSQWKWVPKKNAADVVASTLSPAVRFKLDEIIELPPVIQREIQIEMGQRQRDTYHMLKEHAAALLAEGTITAVNGGVVYSKLLQTSIGWVYGDDGKTYELDNHKRIDALLDVIESATGKVIVFSPFVSAMHGISVTLRRAKIEHANISGKTPAGERGDIFQAFQHTDQYRVLNAHPECMSHGITLTAADTIVWFGPTMKLEVFEQANARITRIGQTRKQQIIRLVASDAERVAYRRLSSRHDLQSNVLDIIAELTGVA